MAGRTFCRFRPFWRSRSGVVAIQIALLMTLLIGFGALGSEVVFLLVMHRTMQSAADAAALGGATAIATGYPASPALEAEAAAGGAGFVNATAGATVTVNIPPQSGPNTGNTSAVEVIIDQPQTLGMIRLFGPATYDVGARAVAIAGSSGQYCVLALDPSASGAITIANNAVVSNPDCGVADNSSSASALVLNANATIDGPVTVHGGWSLGANATLANSQKVSNAATTADPYANVAVQTMPGCTSQAGSGGRNATINLTPGHFCSGWNYSSNVTVNLAPGTYYVDQQLSLANNATLNGTGGVTIVVDGNYALNLSSNVQVNLTAESSGPYAGLAIFGSRTGTSSVNQSFANNVTLNIVGALYFPNQIISINNNGVVGRTGCTQVIGRILNLSNNVYLDNQCAGTGARPIGASPSQLVE